jgi:hypothetical protein
MRASALTSRDAVLRAIAEHDEIGRDAFLAKYGFGRSYRYALVHNGSKYDSKAIGGAALAYQYGPTVDIREGLSGGLAGVVPVLRGLGFTVEDLGPIDEEELDKDPGVPDALRAVWTEGTWRQPDTDANREAALPELRSILDRFLAAETGLSEFVKESQDFAVAKPYWGFRGFAQMQLNQYAKIAEAAGLVEEVEQGLRATLRAPANDDEARAAFHEIGELTSRLIDEAGRLGLGKPAPGRIPLVVSYFWEAQDRDRWPISYPTSKRTLETYDLYRDAGHPADAYLAFRDATIGLGAELGADTWEIEHLLWLFRQEKTPAEKPKEAGSPTARTAPALVSDIYGAYRGQRLIFPDETVTSFLLSLWTKPFVILTGISGTGKTRIAQGLARALEPGTGDRTVEAGSVLEPGDEEHASFRLSDWAIRSGRLYLRAEPVTRVRPPRAWELDQDLRVAGGRRSWHVATEQRRPIRTRRTPTLVP